MSRIIIFKEKNPYVVIGQPHHKVELFCSYLKFLQIYSSKLLNYINDASV